MKNGLKNLENGFFNGYGCEDFGTSAVQILKIQYFYIFGRILLFQLDNN